jgi:hypothetical protein
MGKRADWIKSNDTAPDVRLKPGPAYDTFGAKEYATYHSSGVNGADTALVKYLDVLKENATKVGADPKDIKKYNEYVSRMGASFEQMMTDPEARTAASANPETMAAYKNFVLKHMQDVARSTRSEGAINGADILTNKINPDGTLKT